MRNVVTASKYCYNIVNEIHEITPFNQIRLNWSEIHWIELTLLTFTSFNEINRSSFPSVKWFGDLIEWTRFTPYSHFVFNSFQSAINSISTRWIDWAVELNESLRFTCFAVPFNFHSLRVMKLNCGCSHHIVPLTSLHFILRSMHSVNYTKWRQLRDGNIAAALPFVTFTSIKFH